MLDHTNELRYFSNATWAKSHGDDTMLEDDSRKCVRDNRYARKFSDMSEDEKEVHKNILTATDLLPPVKSWCMEWRSLSSLNQSDSKKFFKSRTKGLLDSFIPYRLIDFTHTILASKPYL